MKKLIFLLLILISYNINAQIDFKRQVPQNPDVAALSKYVLTPVSEFTGVPNINIPLYAVTRSGVSVPISISYHSGGIKVGEEASNVGLGWALNAGGVITRSIEDKDDLVSAIGALPDPPLNGNGFFDSQSNGLLASNGNCEFPFNGNLQHVERPTTVHDLAKGDYIPDVFHYNFNGYSGSFVLKRNGNRDAHFDKKTDLKIKLKGDNNFEAITAEGIKYIFSRKISNRLLDVSTPFPNYISSWYLTQIITPQKTTIDFKYEFREEIEPLNSFRQIYLQHVDTSPFIPQFSSGARMKVKGNYLTEINTANTKVKFVYSGQGERQDIRTGYILEKVEVNSISNAIATPIKTFDLNHSYFVGGGGESLIGAGFGDYSIYIQSNRSDSSLSLRLRLDSIVENNIRTTAFDYHDVPGNLALRKTTMSQDHWGYYNGVINRHSFIPNLNSRNFNPVLGGAFNATPEPDHIAKRYADEDKAKIFMLKKITYPTKGYTEFEHELHTYENNRHNVPAPPQKKIVSSENINGTAGLQTESFEVYSNSSTTRVELDYQFTILDWPGKPASYDPNLNQTPPPIDLANAYIEITDNNGDIVEFTRYLLTQENYTNGPVATGSYKKTVFLRDGTYTIKVHFDGDSPLTGRSLANVSWQSHYLSLDQQFGVGGGFRVKSITDYDSDGSVALQRAYNYHYNDTDNGTSVEKSYGHLRNRPYYGAAFNSHSSDTRNPEPYGRSISGQYINYVSAQSNTTLYQDSGSYVGYDQVSISYKDKTNKDNGKEVFKFYNGIHRLRPRKEALVVNTDEFFGHRFPRIQEPENGLLYEKETYKNNGDDNYTLVAKMEQDYAINGIPITNYRYQDIHENQDYILGGYLISILETSKPWCHAPNYHFQLHPYYSNLVQKTATKETVYDLNGSNPLTVETNYKYNSIHPTLVASTETTNSTGEIIESKVFYPDDVVNTASLGESLTTEDLNAINRLKSTGEECRIGETVQVETINNGRKSVQRTNFKTWDNGITLPTFVQTSKENHLLEDRLVYYRYDAEGNPLEISRANGSHSIFIWGYNTTYPLAKIDNATYQGMPTDVLTLIDQIKNLSNTEDSETEENSLRSLLTQLRNRSYFDNSLMTTYTYDPMVGVTSITDSKGYTMIYFYDELQRLKEVRDHEGNLVSTNEYHYKNQN